MRVTHLSTYHLFGGAAVAATRLHRALQKQSWGNVPVESTMLVGTANRLETHRPESGVLYLANNFLAEQTAFGRFAAERLYFLPHERDRSVRFQFSPAKFGAALDFHPAIQQADVLHLHWINFGFLSLNGLQSLFNLGKPIVWTMHDQWAFTGGCHYSRGCEHFLNYCHRCPYLKKPSENDLSHRVFSQKKTIFGKARIHFTPPSHWLTTEAQRSALLHEFPFSVIPYAIDQTIFKPIDRAEANAHLELPTTDQPRLLFGSANVTDVRKGFRYFAEALTLLHQQHPDVTPEILIFGKGRSYLFDELPYPIRHLGVLTSAEDIVAAYNAADAMVVPSLEDNLPNTVIEAMACGTPVVGFRTGGIPEMIDHHHNGYLADVGSAQQLADGLAFVLEHSSPEVLRQNARQSAENRFSEDVVAKQHIELYQTLMSERAKE
ncbi:MULTISPECIES: glycosyltransferase family 4 protein [unclassified Spirosoma]|uniref:glycosyltransferase family 4 protein n=1 Tax=unclassified Spirosoma TaxID=2621999 RepID=UPI000963AE66|nr:MULTISPECIES: glycosyltransferase family 4 protein [unclassified Spirosoma]MBN8825822.1 glycosyltransferase family 4 protein [Spirosoma sp.]OJW74411.1 MAG: glycosyl transferase family 1 [Spirosoma sp. 48-14]